jgi:O-antigen ligase
LQHVLKTPAGGLPVLLWMVALIGILWGTGLPMSVRVAGLGPFHKLLIIPLLILQFQHSRRAAWVMNGFIASCVVVLTLSWISIWFPRLTWLASDHGGTGVPVKDPIAQTAEFLVCIFLLAPLALRAWQEHRSALAIALTALTLAFLANVLVGTNNRTALVLVPLMMLLFAAMHLSWKGMAGLLAAAIVAAAVVWAAAPGLRANVTSMVHEVRGFQPGGERTRAGERLEFWANSIKIIAVAPWIGHGTGSVTSQFRQLAEGQAGMASLATSNPHNQTFAVAIQLGLLGTIVLFAFWAAHAVLFFRGAGFAAWAGLVVVTQNVIGSLFNSHLFDFTQGWLYVIGVGVAAGTLLKRQPKPDA